MHCAFSNDLRKVPQSVVSYTSKRQYLHASKVLTDALSLINGPLKEVEGLADIRSDLMGRRQHLYQRLHEELVSQIYHNSAQDILSAFHRSNSNRLNQGFSRNITVRRSTDRIEANARIRKALQDMAQGVDLSKTEIIEDADLLDPELSMTYFIAIIVECFGMLGKVPDSVEKLRVGIQTELLEVVRNTTRQLIDSPLITNETYPLLTLLDVIFKQFKSIARTHTTVLKNFLAVVQKYQVVGPQHYSLTDFWSQAQSVVSINKIELFIIGIGLFIMGSSIKHLRLALLMLII